MSSMKLLTSRAAAIAALRPGTGSNVRSAAEVSLPAVLTRYRTITFQVRLGYCEDTLEETLQTLLDRGANYQEIWPGIFEARVPAELDTQPYIAILEMATDAISNVEPQTELGITIAIAPEE